MTADERDLPCPHQRLRAATAPDHDVVDAAFAGFALDEAASYRRFLRAHARALPAMEAVLAATPGAASFRPRTPFLIEDLATLGEEPPALLSVPPLSPAGLLGALYVVEGSRLGGRLLARQVPATLPKAYLSAAHAPGEWRALLAILDTALSDKAACDEAIMAARAAFALYAQAAALET